jgi:CRP/FNR family transcriptional regulator, dissimilatory nitrate respiration regulator
MGHHGMVRRKLRTAFLFAGLAEAELAELAAATHERHYERDEVVILKGDCPSGLFVIVSGTLKIACQSPSGGEKVIDLPGPGQVFGEHSLLLDRPYPFMASTLSPACLLHVAGATLHKLMNRSPDFSRRLLAHLSWRVYSSLRDIEDIRVRPPLERLIGFFLDQSLGETGANGIVPFGAPKHVIASRLGMTPESLSRCLRELSDSGLIAVGADHVSVLDRDRLRCLKDDD